MSERFFPVRPNLEQIRHQAKDLLRAVRAGEPEALAEFTQFHPETIDPAEAKLSDAQLALARAYEIPSWPRLVTACQMIEAIWQGDIETVQNLIRKDPKLLLEQANGKPHSNWGPPMSYAANLGRNEMIELLRSAGAEDIQHAFNRACLQSRLDTARQLVTMGAVLTPGMVMGPCETLSGSGLNFLLELGAEVSDGDGNRLSPLGLVLETYCRNPEGKHQCLELIDQHGTALPDTPVMAVHRGRLDLLQAHIKRDPGVLNRTWSHREIYPLELGCHEDESLARHGTPLAGGTLLHIAVDDDAVEIVQWLLDHGADVNAPAAIDSAGFGGHNVLFGCIVSQAYRCGRQKDGALTQLLLDHGAHVNSRVSLRKRLRFVEDETMHEYPGVTPLSWGQQFHDQAWVNKKAMELVAAAGGQP